MRSAIIIAVLPNVATPGINIVGMMMMLQLVVSFGFILVVNALQNVVACGIERFAPRDVARTGLVMRGLPGESPGGRRPRVLASRPAEDRESPVPAREPMIGRLR